MNVSVFCKCCLQIDVGKKAEAVATVVHAVDQARIREPREPDYAEEAYSEQAVLDYGYKEHALARHVVEVPPEPHVVTKEVKTEEVRIPPKIHVAAAEIMETDISTQVRLSFNPAAISNGCRASFFSFLFFLFGKYHNLLNAHFIG